MSQTTLSKIDTQIASQKERELRQELIDERDSLVKAPRSFALALVPRIHSDVTPTDVGPVKKKEMKREREREKERERLPRSKTLRARKRPIFQSFTIPRMPITVRWSTSW